MLRSAGRASTALILSWLPAHVLLAGLLTLLPRAGNASRHAVFRAAGKLPLLVRYLIIGLLSCGMAATIKALAG